MISRLLAVVLACAAALATTGCTQLAERFTPPPKVVTEEATRAIQGAQVSGELDPGTPADLPLWPDATVLESEVTDDAYSLTLTTTETFTEVLTGVAAGFEEAGWSIAREESGADGARSAVLQISRDAEEGFVTLTELEDATVQIDYVVAIGAQ